MTRQTNYVMGIDPSSTRTGYAVLASPDDLLEAGYLNPVRTRDPAIVRIASMVDDLVTLIRRVCPRTVVIEIPSGHVGRRHGGDGAGLSVYGMAAGGLYVAALLTTRQLDDSTVVPVNENEWTCSVRKAVRRERIAWLFPRFREQLARDKGTDIADGIGVVLWWYANNLGISPSETDSARAARAKASRRASTSRKRARTGGKAGSTRGVSNT